jgi:hypothetical protein
MREITGDIWHFHSKGAWAVIPTNMQYTNDGAVMGAGLALQAAVRFPDLRQKYALFLHTGTSFLVVHEYRLLLLPTKDHWKDPSPMSLIVRGCVNLQTWAELYDVHPPCAIPRLGCGLGGLRWEDVKPVMEEHLTTPNFVVVTPSEC